MMWLFGIFTDLFTACGAIVGGFIVAILALLVIAFYVVAAIVGVIIALSLIYATYYWPRYWFYKLRGKEVPPEPFIIKYEEKSKRFNKWMKDVQTKLDDKVARMKEEQRQREWKS
ncbi:MAG: hypothetical protein IJ632_06580 [Muribaculaceae bacterium]|nr:hypothetical protein [Muribaculaceae bacterium]